MAGLAHQHGRTGRRRLPHRHRVGRNPLLAPLVLFVAATAAAAGYVTYVLWPSWPQSLVALNAPSLPITVAGVSFNVAPAAIRRSFQRHPGSHQRVDLEYLFPSLEPADPRVKAVTSESIDPNTRLFVTIEVADSTLAPVARMREVYPRYLAPAPHAGPPGLTLRNFRNGTPYQGEELAFATKAPAHFLALCSLRGIGNSGICLLERRVGGADITFRFTRTWLGNWQNVAAGIDRLLARLHSS